MGPAANSNVVVAPFTPRSGNHEAIVEADDAYDYFASASAAACWKTRLTSLASLLGKFERCTMSR